MNRPPAELEDQIRAVFAAQARGVDEQAERSPLGGGDVSAQAGALTLVSPDPVFVVQPTDTLRRPARLRMALIIAAALVVVAAGVAAVSRAGGHRAVPAAPAVTGAPALTLPGDIVLGADPLVVQAPLGPEPTFDLARLGAELQFDPVTSLDDLAVRERLDIVAAEVDGLRTAEPDAAGLAIAKVTVSGWLDGKLWLTTVADRPAPPDDLAADPSVTVRRHSWTWFEDGAASLNGPGTAVDGASTEGIALPETSVDAFAPGGGVAGNFPTGPIFVNHLPASVAVVSYEDADQHWWVRPRGGVAAFPADLMRGEAYRLLAYAADGTVLGEEGGDNTLENAPSSFLAEPGEPLLPVPTVDEQGQPVEIMGRGRPLVLVYGASWCRPCETGIAEATAAIDALGDTVDVYAVPFQTDATNAWPQLEAWHHPRIRFDTTAVKNRHRDGVATPLDIAGVPTVLVVGADGVVLARVGFENLAAELARLGLTPPSPPSGDG